MRAGRDSVHPGMIPVDVQPFPMTTGSFEAAAAMLLDMARKLEGSPDIVLHINARNYYFLLRDRGLIEKLRNRAVPLLDGIGLKIAAWVAGEGWLPDLNGTDLFPLVMRGASQEGLRVFLLGSRETVTSVVTERMTSLYPGLKVCGFRSGYFDQSEEEEIVARIRELHPHILMVGMGFPRQESFSLKWGDSTGAGLIWNVGGLFDFVSGRRPRAPLWIRRLRLEWLFRWVIEPKRLFFRTFFHAPVSVVLMILGRLRRR